MLNVWTAWLLIAVELLVVLMLFPTLIVAAKSGNRLHTKTSIVDSLVAGFMASSNLILLVVWTGMMVQLPHNVVILTVTAAGLRLFMMSYDIYGLVTENPVFGAWRGAAQVLALTTAIGMALAVTAVVNTSPYGIPV